MTRSSSQTHRAIVAKESFQTAGEAIGEVTHGMAKFMITRGQFSMIDAILWTLDQVGPARISVWTWTIAEYEVARFRELALDGRVESGTLVIDHGARQKNAHLIREWKQFYGDDSVRYVLNHAKIATVEGANHRVLLRGSMNLNHNPRFEQADVSEGCPGFDLVRELENELPVLPDDTPGAACYKATKVGAAFNKEQLGMFSKLSTWSPK